MSGIRSVKRSDGSEAAFSIAGVGRVIGRVRAGGWLITCRAGFLPDGCRKRIDKFIDAM